MIAFSCSHCGMKFKVKPEFAGRSSKCPTCKQPLVVPTPELTQAYDPAGQIEGSHSSLAQAGVEGGVTLEPAAPAQPGQKPIHELLAKRTKNSERYIIEQEIARGGMGAVLRAVDCDIRREVAVKFLLNQADARSKARFVEEAQITGQLEHPNIVPIHELGVDAQGRLFFTMKLVQGRSLAKVLDDLREVPRVFERAWPLSRLLTIVVNVCHALAYAHSRGVIHRDLKPANIMIGDFGEVYVMDWGLARVLHGDGGEPGKAAPAFAVPVPADGTVSAPLAVPVPPSSNISARQFSKVETSRASDADLTQDGTILGTPVYMPPEQARGNIGDIDQRSDVYSLGAILYEMLTLLPPIDKEGGYLSILMRVTEGIIQPPGVRAPKRARAGKIPKELSAVAMKALAKDRADRYPNVEGLRRDIEWFQEGRSVSAKEDTFREMAWKLVKRNKGASVATGIGLLVLLAVLVISFHFINAARLRAEDERNNAQVERGKAEAAYQAYQDQVKGSVPLLLRAAKAALGDRQYDDALVQASIAAKSAPDNAEARLLKGQLLITRMRFAEAAWELEEYRKLKGEDAGVQKLTELCRRAQPEDVNALLAFAEVFTQRGEHALADGVMSGEGKTAVEARKSIQEARQRTLEIYRKRIEAAWPGQGNKLKMSKEGLYALNKLDKVTDLTPLKGMRLTTLNVNSSEIRDLEPLKGMPLASLHLDTCRQVQDLRPLKGMPLTALNLFRCSQVRDLEPLKGMPLTALILGETKVRDLEPLKGMPLTALSLSTCRQVQNLRPLKGVPLTALNLFRCSQVRDLEPLKGMPLTALNIGSTQVRDLEPLKGMPLTALDFSGCKQVGDLEPLKGMALTALGLADTQAAA